MFLNATQPDVDDQSTLKLDRCELISEIIYFDIERLPFLPTLNSMKFLVGVMMMMILIILIIAHWSVFVNLSFISINLLQSFKIKLKMCHQTLKKKMFPFYFLVNAPFQSLLNIYLCISL